MTCKLCLSSQAVDIGYFNEIRFEATVQRISKENASKTAEKIKSSIGDTFCASSLMIYFEDFVPIFLIEKNKVVICL